ncbi:MAG: hypothetical protein CYG60_16890 [Actinobacteria bacterium]|nr:MAG: hypothetical protein CYG60_16890 [Actinomycetota bacterium]
MMTKAITVRPEEAVLAKAKTIRLGRGMVEVEGLELQVVERREVGRPTQFALKYGKKVIATGYTVNKAIVAARQVIRYTRARKEARAASAQQASA